MKFLLNHALFFTYSVTFSFLMLGLYVHSGVSPVWITTLFFFLPFTALYMLTARFKFSLPRLSINMNCLTRVLLVASVFIAVVHCFALGHVPIFKALLAEKQTEVNAVRLGISQNTPSLLIYLESWNIKAIVPFLILFFLRKKHWVLFLIVCFLGLFLSVAFMQKANIIWVFSPMLLWLLFNKKWLSFVLGGFGVIMLLFVMVWTTNAALRGGINDVSSVVFDDSVSNQSRISQGLARRVFLVPGMIVGEWYRIIPDEKPFLYGRDFGLYCKISGQSKLDYSKELYPLIYPEYAESGLEGSVNVAHFMRSYANFGKFGLILAGVLLTIVLFVLRQVGNNTPISLWFSLNAFPIVLLNSGSILTLLISGGWLILIVLLWLQNSSETEVAEPA